MVFQMDMEPHVQLQSLKLFKKGTKRIGGFRWTSVIAGQYQHLLHLLPFRIVVLLHDADGIGYGTERKPGQFGAGFRGRFELPDYWKEDLLLSP